MTDNELLQALASDVSALRDQLVGPEGTWYAASVPYLLSVLVMAVCFLCGLQFWKWFVYTKNQRHWWALLLSLGLAASLASEAHALYGYRVSSGWFLLHYYDGGAEAYDGEVAIYDGASPAVDIGGGNFEVCGGDGWLLLYGGSRTFEVGDVVEVHLFSPSDSTILEAYEYEVTAESDFVAIPLGTEPTETANVCTADGSAEGDCVGCGCCNVTITKLEIDYAAGGFVEYPTGRVLVNGASCTVPLGGCLRCGEMRLSVVLPFLTGGGGAVVRVEGSSCGGDYEWEWEEGAGVFTALHDIGCCRCEDDDGDGEKNICDCDDDDDGQDDVDEDDDEDGIPNDEDDDDDDDGCLDNEECEDDDEDGNANCEDGDDDNDGVPDHADCDWHGEPGGCTEEEEEDDDDDGVANGDDWDRDGDGIPNWQEDWDDDGIPNWQDDDDDNDGIPDDADDDDGDGSPGDDGPGGGFPDNDGDGIPDDVDEDDDNDGVPDEEDDDDDDDGILDDEDCGLDDRTHDDEEIVCQECFSGPPPFPGIAACGEDDEEDDEDDDEDDDEEGGDCVCCDELLDEVRGLRGDLTGGSVGDLPSHVDPGKVAFDLMANDDQAEEEREWYGQRYRDFDAVVSDSSGTVDTDGDGTPDAQDDDDDDDGDPDASDPDDDGDGTPDSQEEPLNDSSVKRVLPGVESIPWIVPAVGAEPTDLLLCVPLPMWGSGVGIGDWSMTNMCLHSLPLENVGVIGPELLWETFDLFRQLLRFGALTMVVIRYWLLFAGLLKEAM